VHEVVPSAAARELLTFVDIEPAALVGAVTVDGLPVFGFPADLPHPGDLWLRLRTLHDTTGLWPFLSDESPAQWAQWCCDAPGAPQRLARALAARPSEVIDELIAAHSAGAFEYRTPNAELNAYSLNLFDVGHTRAMIGSDPPARPRTMHSEIAGVMDEPEWLCLVPARAGYELPALLNAPHANDWHASRTHDRLTCEDHVGVLRSWQERFGADVRYLSVVALGLVVAAPPMHPYEVARVAVEQYAYCDDLDQFLGEPHHVAQLQVPTDRWYFWWD
jgi:hypothetical protein